MMQAIYYMKLELLINIITFVTVEETNEIELMSEFVGLFYAMWFLRTALPAAAPYHDLKSFQQMQKYKKLGKVRAKMAETCMVSLASRVS